MIKFGTDGWRAVISKDYTFDNVKIVAQAIADYIKEIDDKRPVLVGYDTRFMSEEYARLCAGVLVANGTKTYLTKKPTPTPVVSFTVKNMNLAGAIMITASHNPPQWNGIKFKGDYGGSALPSIIAEIEKHLYKNEVKFVEPEESSLFSFIDADKDYFEHIEKLVDLNLIAKFKPFAIIDPMHGAGVGYVKTLLEKYGIKHIQIRDERNPYFGGVNPEPIYKNLGKLIDTVVQNNADIGLATDGDADRVGAVDEKGEFIDSHRIYALLLRHLVEAKGLKGGVVKTFSTTNMVPILANKYGLKIYETPIGFKYICELFLKEDILIGGEESGGIGIKNHIPERDGILCSLLLLEIMAYYQKPISQILDELFKEIGYHYYDRVDLHLPIEIKEKTLKMISQNTEFAGRKIKEIQTLDGYKYIFEDGSWILFRASGTEPVLRVYTEQFTKDEVKRLLDEAVKMIEEMK